MFRGYFDIHEYKNLGLCPPSSIYIYIYKVVISVCIFVSDHNSVPTFANLPQVLIGELGRTTGMFLAWF